MTESGVTYILPTQGGGAIPTGTRVATHLRDDGKEIQDVWLSALPTGSVIVLSSALPSGASTSANQITGTAYLASLLSAVQSQLSTLNPQQIGVDAGGIQRFAQQTTLFDGKLLNADDTDIFENVTSGGSGTFTNNKFEMSVFSNGNYYIKQSKRYFPYFSGKSQRVETTVDTFAPQTGTVKNLGYFSSSPTGTYDSAYDGIWLESNGQSGTLYLRAARAGTDTMYTPLSQWSGVSQLAEYTTGSVWNNFSVAESKFLWLGGAVWAFSLKNSRGFIEAHRFNYAGTSSDVFIKSPNQPIRYGIRSVGGVGTLRYICSQVATEGSINESGNGFSVYNSTSIACNAIGTHYALIGLKKQATFRDTPIQIVDVSIGNTATADAGILLVIINPTLSAPLSYSNLSKFQVAYATNQTVTAGTGRVIAAIPVSQSGGQTDVLKDNFLGWLSILINNTPDEYVIAYMSTTANQSVNAVVNLKLY
jgi:hypothetical protein